MIAQEKYVQLNAMILSGKAENVPRIAKALGMKLRQIKYMLEVLNQKRNCTVKYNHATKRYEYLQGGLQAEDSLVDKYGSIVEELDRLRRSVEILMNPYL